MELGSYFLFLQEQIKDIIIIIHCNAEFQLTRALSGDPRRGSIDEEGVIILVVRASKPIKCQETVLVHYNPRGGIQSWESVFKCTCCLCRGKC